MSKLHLLKNKNLKLSWSTKSVECAGSNGDWSVFYTNDPEVTPEGAHTLVHHTFMGEDFETEAIFGTLEEAHNAAASYSGGRVTLKRTQCSNCSKFMRRCI